MIRCLRTGSNLSTESLTSLYRLFAIDAAPAAAARSRPGHLAVPYVLCWKERTHRDTTQRRSQMKHPIKIPAEFSLRDDRLAWLMVAANMLVVLCAGIVAWWLGSWWGYIIAFVLVGARGQACYVLQHEAMHNLLF